MCGGIKRIIISLTPTSQINANVGLGNVSNNFYPSVGTYSKDKNFYIGANNGQIFTKTVLSANTNYIIDFEYV